MFFKTELNKISSRSFNYYYGLLVILLSAFMTYKIDFLASFFNIASASVVFDIVLKIIFILIMFLMGINFIYSYRDDYKSKVVVLLKNKKLLSRKNIFSVLANSFYFFSYTIFHFMLVFVIIYLKGKNTFNDIVKILKVDNHLLAYVCMLILLIVFSNLIFLLMLTLFNNTNIAISLSLLYFVGSGVLSEILLKKFPAKFIDNSILNIFNISFNKWNHYLSFSDVAVWVSLLINIFVLVLFIILIRLVKRK